MKLTVNGEAREVQQEETIIGLLQKLGMQPKGTVVERNGEIVDSTDFEGTMLTEGDKLELVRFVGGG